MKTGLVSRLQHRLQNRIQYWTSKLLMEFLVFCILLSGFLLSAPARAEEVFRIEIGSRENGSREEMSRRVYELERAVQQLQRRVFELELKKTEDKSSVTTSMTTCYITTAFNGTFSATEMTETAARAKALEKCSAVVQGIGCEEHRLKCGK